jgi:phosphatidylserine/phosphatidylglycerophosphate/cardiolipin synthase-like enzyme
VVAHYEGALANQADDGARAVPVAGEEILRLPNGFAGGHLQILDLAAWLAPAVPNPLTSAWPARFRTHSHVLPLVDGIDSFRRLVPDLRATRFTVRRPGEEIERGGAHLAGWAFDDFAMLPGDDTTKLPALAELIRTPPDGDAEEHGDIRILAAQFLQAEPDLFQTLDESKFIVLMIVLLAGASAELITLEAGVTNEPGLVTFQLAMMLAAIAAAVKFQTASDIEAAVKDLVERTKPELIDTLNEQGKIALYSPHPVRLADNPLATDFDAAVAQLSDLDTHFGVYHQKLQVIRRQPDADHPDSGDGFHYAGYVGGIDIASNRVDTPGHHGKRSFHDVHSRVTGPAVLDLIGTFHDRWLRDRQADPDAPPPVFDPPDSVAPAGGHIVQVGRTAFGPGPGGEGFAWAPGGDRTTRESIGRAIEAATEYIYVEDQYFAPDNEYVQLLRDRSDHCKRLVVVMPSEPDQPLSTDRVFRVFDRLTDAWGERLYIGAPLRRPVLVPTGKTSSVGRCVLVEDVPDAVTDQIFLGPPTRVPKTTPYFVWVGGELMAAQKATLVTAPSGKPAMRLDVLRGGLGTQPRWYDHPQGHATGEPATIVKPKGIYVHSKTIMVDDVFVGIGSTNTNRRGFFHDGEITAFAIPERLRAARDNPARALRTALWAEHLGIPPAMGPALLADPLAAFDLFRRTRYQGNRLARFRELAIPFAGINKLVDYVPESLHVPAILVTTFGEAILETFRPEVWNTLSDPTSAIDPDPTPGPDLPPP